jgi:hypothetical protein
VYKFEPIELIEMSDSEELTDSEDSCTSEDEEELENKHYLILTMEVYILLNN